MRYTLSFLDGIVKTLLLRHCKFAVVTTYLSTTHSIKFAFLEYYFLYLSIHNFNFYEPIKDTLFTKCY